MGSRAVMHVGLGLAGGALLGAGGFALAATHGASGVIHGCYAKNGGGLRVISASKSCARNERAISWSRTGPRGPRGAPGPSSARVALLLQGPELVPADDSYRTIVTMPKLAAGTYEITGWSNVDFNGVSTQVDLQCRIAGPASVHQGYYAATAGPEGILTPETIGFVTLSAPSNVSLQCLGQTTDTGVTWDASQSEVIARSIGSVSFH